MAPPPNGDSFSWNVQPETVRLGPQFVIAPPRSKSSLLPSAKIRPVRCTMWGECTSIRRLAFPPDRVTGGWSEEPSIVRFLLMISTDDSVIVCPARCGAKVTVLSGAASRMAWRSEPAPLHAGRVDLLPQEMIGEHCSVLRYGGGGAC